MALWTRRIYLEIFGESETAEGGCQRHRSFIVLTQLSKCNENDTKDLEEEGACLVGDVIVEI